MDNEFEILAAFPADISGAVNRTLPAIILQRHTYWGLPSAFAPSLTHTCWPVSFEG